jgi:hypothetical protein
MTFNSAMDLLKIRSSKEFLQYNKTFKQHCSISIPKKHDLTDHQIQSRIRLAHIRSLESAGLTTSPDQVQKAFFELGCELLGNEDLIRFFKPVLPSLFGDSKKFADYLDE